MKIFWITSSISLVKALYDPLFETNDLTYRIFEGEENTSFGYSLTLSNNNEILVGAPRKDREKTRSSSVAPDGTIYDCKYDQFRNDFQCNDEGDSNNFSLWRGSIRNKFIGMTLQYHKGDNTLATCAPGSWTREVIPTPQSDFERTRINTIQSANGNVESSIQTSTGFCEIIKNYKQSNQKNLYITRPPIKNEDERLYRTLHNLKCNAKNFGYALELMGEKDKILTSSPGSHYWTGSIQVTNIDDRYADKNQKLDVTRSNSGPKSFNIPTGLFSGSSEDEDAENYQAQLREKEAYERSRVKMPYIEALDYPHQIKFRLLKDDINNSFKNRSFENDYGDEIDIRKDQSSFPHKDKIIDEETGLRMGQAIKYFTCSEKSDSRLRGGKLSYAIVNSVDPEGFLVFYSIGHTGKKPEMKFLRSSKPTFGDKFGFSFDVVNIDGNTYLLVSSPFAEGTNKKLQFYQLKCTGYLYRPKLEIIDVTDEKLVMPQQDYNNIFDNSQKFNENNDRGLFGYSIKNVGNIDTSDGDEVLVSSPHHLDSFLYIFSVRDNKLQMVQKLKSSKVPYMGLTLTKNLKDLDKQAGIDILAAGQDSLVVIPSKPTFSLTSDLILNYGQFGGRSGNVIKIDDPGFGSAQSTIQLCIDIKSNVKKDKIKKIKATLILDSKRDKPNKRFEFGGNNKSSKQIIFTRKPNSQTGTAKNGGIRYCTDLITDLNKKLDILRCPKNRFLSVSEPIRFDLQHIERYSSRSFNEDDKAVFIDNSKFKTYHELIPQVDCDQNCRDGLELTLTAQNTGKPKTIQLSNSPVNQKLNFQLKNKSNRFSVPNVFLQIKTNDPSIEIFDPHCLKKEDKTFICQVTECSVAVSAKIEIPTINLRIDTMKAETTVLKIEYQLLQNDHKLATSDYITYSIELNHNIEINYKSVGIQVINYQNDTDFRETINRNFDIRNVHEMVDFTSYKTIIYVPMGLKKGDETEFIWKDPEHSKVQTSEGLWVGLKDKYKGYNQGVEIRKNLIGKTPKNQGNENSLIQPLKPGIIYDKYILTTATSSGQRINHQKKLSFTISGVIKKEIFESDTFQGFLGIKALVNFQVFDVQGPKFLVKGGSKNLSKFRKSQLISHEIPIREYKLEKRAEVIIQRARYTGLIIGLIVSLLILLICVVTGIFGKKVFFKTEE